LLRSGVRHRPTEQLGRYQRFKGTTEPGRLQQRGIPPMIVDLLEQFGSQCDATGADIAGPAEERHVAVEDALDQARKTLAGKPE